VARRRPSEASVNPARGAILVVVAVLLGLFLLRHGLNSTTTISTAPSHVTSRTTTTTSGSTVTTLAVRAPAQTPTIVLNGSGVVGAAKKYSDALAHGGYDLTNSLGANATANVGATQVLFAPGFNQEAIAVAAAIGAPATSVGPLPATLPGKTSGASVVVVLGPDLGSKTPPTVTTTTAAGG
jgi:hypothetical protein